MNPSETFLTERQLAARYCVSLATVRAWRLHGRGPVYSKLENSVRYSIRDLEAFEQASRRRSTGDNRPPVEGGAS